MCITNLKKAKPRPVYKILQRKKSGLYTPITGMRVWLTGWNYAPKIDINKYSSLQGVDSLIDHFGFTNAEGDPGFGRASEFSADHSGMWSFFRTEFDVKTFKLIDYVGGERVIVKCRTRGRFLEGYQYVTLAALAPQFRITDFVK